uniref:Wsv295-like protein n=1 Tax=Trachysalambria curvirostris nimavirus TaxID=2984282 RepID=A0A9C7BR64_9VIRU|nr:MAG: wsv295-like protein [Trachysalambria curvirostris nimavirus]
MPLYDLRSRLASRLGDSADTSQALANVDEDKIRVDDNLTPLSDTDKITTPVTPPPQSIPLDSGSSEDWVADTGDECHDDARNTKCCGLRDISVTLASGFCKFVNTLASCIRDKLTNRQFFLLVGAAMAALFGTRNVAMDDGQIICDHNKMTKMADNADIDQIDDIYQNSAARTDSVVDIQSAITKIVNTAMDVSDDTEKCDETGDGIDDEYEKTAAGTEGAVDIPSAIINTIVNTAMDLSYATKE